MSKDGWQRGFPFPRRWCPSHLPPHPLGSTLPILHCTLSPLPTFLLTPSTRYLRQSLDKMLCQRDVSFSRVSQISLLDKMKKPYWNVFNKSINNAFLCKSILWVRMIKNVLLKGYSGVCNISRELPTRDNNGIIIFIPYPAAIISNLWNPSQPFGLVHRCNLRNFIKLRGYINRCLHCYIYIRGKIYWGRANFYIYLSTPPSFTNQVESILLSGAL